MIPYSKGKCLDLLSNSLNSFMEGNVCRSVWRICMCILGLKGLRLNFIWNRWDLYQFSFLALEKHWETTQTFIKKSMLFSLSCERHLLNVSFFFFRNWLRGRRWRRSLIFTFAQQASHIIMWSKIIQIPNVAWVEIKLTMQCGFKVVIYCIILLIWKANLLLLAELLRSFLDK